MLEKIKTLIGDNVPSDKILEALIEIATAEVKSYCGIKEVSGLENIIIQIVIIKFNRLGAEGVSSESFTGVSYVYEMDYPPFIMSLLNKNRRCKFI